MKKIFVLLAFASVLCRGAVPVLDATGKLDNGYMPLDLSTMTGTFGGLYVTAYSLGTVAGAGTATLVPGKSSYVLTTSGSTWTLSCPGTMPDGDVVIYGTSTYNGGTQTATLSNAAVRPEQDPTSTTNKFYIASAPSSRYVVYLRLLSGVIDEFSVVGDTFSPGGGAALWASDGSTLSPSPAVDRIDISPSGQIYLAGTSPNDSNWSEFGVATNGTLGFVAVGDVDVGASTNWMFFVGSYTNITNQEGSWLFSTGNASTRLAEFDVTSGGPAFNNSVTLQSGNDIGNIRILGNGGTPLSLDPFVVSSGSAVAHSFGTINVLTNGDKLLSIANASTPVFAVGPDSSQLTLNGDPSEFASLSFQRVTNRSTNVGIHIVNQSTTDTDTNSLTFFSPAIWVQNFDTSSDADSWTYDGGDSVVGVYSDVSAGGAASSTGAGIGVFASAIGVAGVQAAVVGYAQGASSTNVAVVASSNPTSSQLASKVNLAGYFEVVSGDGAGLQADPNLQSGVVVLDSRNSGLPLLIARTNNSSSSVQAKIDVDGTLTAGDPGSGQGSWKLGTVITGASVVLVTTNYVEVKINGNVVKLAIVQ